MILSGSNSLHRPRHGQRRHADPGQQPGACAEHLRRQRRRPLSFGTLAAATFGGLQGTNPFNLQKRPAPVTLSVGNASTTFDGVLGGSGSLIKVGTGIFTLTNAQQLHRRHDRLGRDAAVGQRRRPSAPPPSAALLLKSGGGLDLAGCNATVFTFTSFQAVAMLQP